LNDGDEVTTHGTNPNLADTDGDSLSDADEINIHNTSPTSVDTHNDGLRDDFLVGANLNPALNYSNLLTDTVLNGAGYYSSQEAAVLDARAGSVAMEMNNGAPKITLQVERSDGSDNWSADANDAVEVDVTADNAKEFYRFSLPQN
jgi:hypothetical protein